MAPMTEKQMPTMAVQPRPREVKVNEERAPLETNNNTRMVNGGNIDYNKLISPDNVPGKNISSDAATTPTPASKTTPRWPRPGNVPTSVRAPDVGRNNVWRRARAPRGHATDPEREPKARI